jgi:hypothetical protein
MFAKHTTTDETIPVYSHRGNDFAYVRLSDIRVVRRSTDDLIDVIYSARSLLPSGIEAREIRSGYSTIDKIFLALGWHASLRRNEKFAANATST